MKDAVISYFSSWDFFRLFRLLLGVIILTEAIGRSDIMLGIFAFIFSAMAVFNMGCCGSSGCYTPNQRNREANGDTQYTDIK